MLLVLLNLLKKLYNYSLFFSLFFFHTLYGQIKIDSIVAINRTEFNNDNTSFHSPNNKIDIPFDKNFLLIYYSSSKDTIQFFIKGLNNKWMSCRNIGQFLLANLPNGEFELQLKDNTSKTRLILAADSPIWSKWWFVPLALCFVLSVIGIIIYLILQYRFRQQTKLQRVRDNIASDLHDDVGATLSSISFFGEMMRSKIMKNAPKEEVLPLLDKLISTSKETIETMRGVVWTINPNNDNAIDFFQKLQSFGREMLAAKNIDFELFISDFENTKLPLDIQRNFFLFYKEVINNIAKHSKATYVKATIEALEKNAGIAFKIIDNGVGFDSNDVYEGHGLKSLRKRAEELEGNLNIESAEGKGTSISLSFVLP